MTRRSALVLTLLAGLLAMASPAHADDAFLQVADPAIRGESVAKGFEGAIEVQAFAWGVQTTPSGRPTFSSLFITKAVDRSSPALMASLASGSHLKSARLSLRTAGGDPRTYLEYCIENVTVVSQQAGGQASARPTETIGLAFTRFAQRYSYFDDNGAKTGEEASGWDTALNASAPFLATCGAP